MESLLQAGPSVDWERNKENAFLHESTIMTCAVDRSLNRLPSGLPGAI